MKKIWAFSLLLLGSITLQGAERFETDTTNQAIFIEINENLVKVSNQLERVMLNQERCIQIADSIEKLVMGACCGEEGSPFGYEVNRG